VSVLNLFIIKFVFRQMNAFTKHRDTKRSTTNATSLRCTLCVDLLHL